MLYCSTVVCRRHQEASTLIAQSLKTSLSTVSHITRSSSRTLRIDPWSWSPCLCRDRPTADQRGALWLLSHLASYSFCGDCMYHVVFTFCWPAHLFFLVSELSSQRLLRDRHGRTHAAFLAPPSCRRCCGFSPVNIALSPAPMVTITIAMRYWISWTTHLAGPHRLLSTLPAPRMNLSVREC